MMGQPVWDWGPPERQHNLALDPTRKDLDAIAPEHPPRAPLTIHADVILAIHLRVPPTPLPNVTLNGAQRSEGSGGAGVPAILLGRVDAVPGPAKDQTVTWEAERERLDLATALR